MRFDQKAFSKQAFTPRTEAVEVKALAQWFTDLPDGESPTWTVRGLTADELGRADEAAERQRNLADALEAFAGAVGPEKVVATQELLGVKRGGIPAETAKRQEMLVLGSVDPEITLDVARKLGKTFPVEFRLLTNKIVILSGQGSVPGKSPPSGDVQT